MKITEKVYMTFLAKRRMPDYKESIMKKQNDLKIGNPDKMQKSWGLTRNSPAQGTTHLLCSLETKRGSFLHFLLVDVSEFWNVSFDGMGIFHGGGENFLLGDFSAGENA